MALTRKWAIDSDLKCIPLLGEELCKLCTTLDEKTLYEIELCLVEAVANIIIHAYRQELGHPIEISISLDHNHLIIEIQDEGLKAPHLASKDNQISDSQDIQQLSESGRGLLLMQSFMDKIDFEEKNGKNITRLYKSITN